MYVWQAKLLVRLRACEGRLSDYRERHARMVEWRQRYTFESVSWHDYDRLVKQWRDKIDRELDEIQFVNMLIEVGPIVGGEISLAREFGTGPTIIDLIEREKEKFLYGNGEEPNADTAAGIERALDVIRQPYRFLNEEEREGFKKAEKVARLASEEEQNRVAPNRRTRQDNREVKPPVAKAVLVRINPETGKAEAGF